MANVRIASLLAQRKASVGSLYSSSGKIRLLSPSNNSVATIAKQAASSELDRMTANYNAGTISNEDMRAFLDKLSTNIGLSASDKLEVQKQIIDFDNRVIGEKLQASYKAAPDNSLAQMQAAQALSSFYAQRAATQQPGTPAQSQNLQDSSTWANQVTAIKTSIQKTAASTLRYQEELKVNAIADNTSEQANQKATMWKSLYDRAVADGDSVAASKYAAYYQDAITSANTLSTNESTKANKKQLTDFINNTLNDYHDGKVSGEQALASLEEANKFAYDQGDTAALNRLNGLSVTINREIDKGITYSSVNGLSQKSGSGGGSGEIYLNPDGSLSSGGGATRVSGGGGGVTVSTGINPLIKKYFPKEQWATAQAVMLAESGGNASAVGDNYPINGQTIPSYGLFQIRALPGRPGNMTDPEANVAYAAQLWKAQGWQPWSAYTNGNFRQYLGQASAPGNGEITSTTKKLGGSGNMPKSLTELDIEYKNNLNEANRALVAGEIPASSSNPKVKSYTQYILLASKERELQLRNIQVGLDKLSASGITKIGKKNVEDLRKENTVQLNNIVAQSNQIKSGNLVLAIKNSDFTDAVGNKSSKPTLQWVPKNDAKNMIQANGVYHPTRNEDVVYKDQKSALAYAKDKSTNDVMLTAVQNASGQWSVVDGNGSPVKRNLLDVTDPNGNTVTYESDAKYGWLPQAVGPRTGALRAQIVKEFDAAAGSKQAYKQNLLDYNQLNSFDFKKPAGTTQPLPPEEANGFARASAAITGAGAAIADTVGKVVAPVLPKPQYPSGEQLGITSSTSIPSPNLPSFNPMPASNATQVKLPSSTSSPTQLKLATQQPSPVAQWANTNNIPKIKIAAPPKASTPQTKPNALAQAGGAIGKAVDTGLSNLKKLLGIK